MHPFGLFEFLKTLLPPAAPPSPEGQPLTKTDFSAPFPSSSPLSANTRNTENAPPRRQTLSDEQNANPPCAAERLPEPTAERLAEPQEKPNACADFLTRHDRRIRSLTAPKHR